MKFTLRNPVDGSTVEVDDTDTERVGRLTKIGYRPVGEQVTVPKGARVIATKDLPARKRTPKK